MIEYRQATLNDKSRILDFYKGAYPGEEFLRSVSQWEWEYVLNPFKKNKIGIWLAIDTTNDKIVGHTGVIFEKIKIDKNEFQIGWGVDFIVLPEYRGKRIAFNLQKKMIEEIDIYMNISMSETTRIISNKLGAVDTPNVTQYVYPLYIPHHRILHYFSLLLLRNNTLLFRGGRFLLKMKPVIFMLKYTGILVLSKLMIDIKNKLKHQSFYKGLGFEIKPFHHLKDIDRIWERVNDTYDKIVRRDETYFDWKYHLQSHKYHYKYIVYKNNDPIGYIVLREGGKEEPNVGIIVDYLLPPTETMAFDTILKFSINFFKQRKKEFIYMNISVDSFKNIVRKNAFKKTRVHTSSFLTLNEQLKKQITTNPGNWFLTSTDHELDRYPIRGK